MPCPLCPWQVGVKCVVLKGSMSMEQRDRMISAFTEDPDVTVFLMSLKAGGAPPAVVFPSCGMLLCDNI